jgi:hypothetical protein
LGASWLPDSLTKVEQHLVGYALGIKGHVIVVLPVNEGHQVVVDAIDAVFAKVLINILSREIQHSLRVLKVGMVQE